MNRAANEAGHSLKAGTDIPASRGEGDRVAAVSGGRKPAVYAEDDAHSIDRKALGPWAITAQAANSLDPWPRPGRLPAETSSAPPHRWGEPNLT